MLHSNSVILLMHLILLNSIYEGVNLKTSITIYSHDLTLFQSQDIKSNNPKSTVHDFINQYIVPYVPVIYIPYTN